jgi:hypothetical protein
LFSLKEEAAVMAASSVMSMARLFVSIRRTTVESSHAKIKEAALMLPLLFF